MIIHPSNYNEYKDLIAKGNVLVDFFATWCGPCKMLAPVLEELDETKKDIQIVKVDVDMIPDAARELGIQAVPTLILFQNGKRIKATAGYQSLDSLLEFLS